MPRTDAQQPDLNALRRALRHLGALRGERVLIPGTSQRVTVLRPVETDRLLDLAADDPEQNLPYWAELWPSGIALAAAIAARPALVRGQRALELGCGLGLTAMLALAAGAELTITDYSRDALALARFNCLRHAGRAPAAWQVNWRSPDATSAAPTGDGFPVVLAADVLYEGRDVQPLLALAPRLVAPGGLLWLAEPGRRPARAFLDEMERRGWRDRPTTCTGPWPDPKDAGVVVTVHLLQRPTGSGSRNREPASAAIRGPRSTQNPHLELAACELSGIPTSHVLANLCDHCCANTLCTRDDSGDTARESPIGPHASVRLSVPAETRGYLGGLSTWIISFNLLTSTP